MLRPPFLVLILALIPSTSQAELVILYDGNGLPASQPWLAYGNDSVLTGGSASQATVSGGVSLTTDNAVSAGYSNYDSFSPKAPAFPTLDRDLGFELAFSARLDSESHLSDNRAGFSVILLGSDRKGIEIGFWENEIWSQTDSPAFTHGAGISIDTRIERNYRLTIRNDQYSLSEGNSTLLTGTVQDYTSSGVPVYMLPNFLFLGDNTSSASADLFLGPITLQSNLSAVPEPSSFFLAGLSMMGVLARQRRRNH